MISPLGLSIWMLDEWNLCNGSSLLNCRMMHLHRNLCTASTHSFNPYQVIDGQLGIWMLILLSRRGKMEDMVQTALSWNGCPASRSAPALLPGNLQA